MGQPGIDAVASLLRGRLRRGSNKDSMRMLSRVSLTLFLSVSENPARFQAVRTLRHNLRGAIALTLHGNISDRPSKSVEEMRALISLSRRAGYTQQTSIHFIMSTNINQQYFFFTRFWILDKIKYNATVVLYTKRPSSRQLTL